MEFLKINTTSIETIEQSFKSIASMLFCYKINVNGQCYRFLDIEFYYSFEGTFDDPYIHGNKLQTESGRWYFHESGMDITFGADGNHGGILIRGIGKLSKDGEEGIIENEIHGPLKVVKELTSNFYPIMNSSSNKFCLEKMNVDKEASVLPMEIIKTNRIGLKTHPSDYKDFKQKPYRFIAAFPDKNAKNKFKDKERVIKAAVKENHLDEEVAIKILGYKTDFT